MINFPDKEQILIFHEDQLNQYGGNRGVRDSKLLSDILSGIRDKARSRTPDLFDIAADYGYAICTQKPFFDGSKRTALVVIFVFLYANDILLNASEESMFSAIESLNNGELTKHELAEFLKIFSEPLNSSEP